MPNKHLSNYTDHGNKTDIPQQRDNLWQIRSMADKQSCINDIRNADVFSMLRNAFEKSSTIIVRATNVIIQVFPVGSNDLGRGLDSDDEEGDDENYLDDEAKEDDDVEEEHETDFNDDENDDNLPDDEKQ